MGSIVEVIQLSGILNSDKAQQLRRHISDVMTTRIDVVLIDLQNVTFIDSSGLGGLISAQRIVQAANGKLFICSVNNQARMLFDLTKMNHLFTILADKEEFDRTVLSTNLAASL